jgi:hypothetical protein
MATKKKADKKLMADERMVDILECFAAAQLYIATPLVRADIAKISPWVTTVLMKS